MLRCGDIGPRRSPDSALPAVRCPCSAERHRFGTGIGAAHYVGGAAEATRVMDANWTSDSRRKPRVRMPGLRFARKPSKTIRHPVR